MVDNEVIVEETNVDTTENKFEVPESFKEKYSENPDRAIEELYKAQHKIVAQKKADKVVNTTETTGNNKEDFNKFYQEQRFFEENKHLEEHKDYILELTSKGNSFEDAKYLAEKKDPTIQNRATAQKTNFTSGTPDFSQTSYTQAELASKSQSEYNHIMKLREQGKAIII